MVGNFGRFEIEYLGSLFVLRQTLLTLPLATIKVVFATISDFGFSSEKEAEQTRYITELDWRIPMNKLFDKGKI